MYAIRSYYEFLDEFALRQQYRFDDVAGEEAVLGADAGVQRQLGELVGDEVQVRGFLRVLGEDLEEPRVVHGMVIVMPRMHVQGVLGHGVITSYSIHYTKLYDAVPGLNIFW